MKSQNSELNVRGNEFQEVPMSIHEYFMLKAIEVAKANPLHPFGAVIMHNTTHVIAAEGFNQTSANPILHGEISAISNYAATGAAEWPQLTLYTTAEPCPMCMSAILWTGISSVVFGTSIPTLAKLGWKQINFRSHDIVAKSHRPDCQVIAGVLEESCDEMFKKAVEKESE